MKINVFSVAAIVVCLTFAIVWADIPPASSVAADANAGQGTEVSRQKRGEDCESKPICPKGRECRMIRGVRACLKYSSVCYLPFSIRPCHSTTPTYYYNPDKMICEKYEKGECAGNKNVFKKMGQCYMTCQKLDPSFCELSRETKPCNSRVQRYSFNRLTRRCKKIPFGQCSTNNNQFRGLGQCQKVCKPGRQPYINPSVCQLSKSTRPCEETSPTYYFNRYANRCSKFSPGECSANKNKFYGLGLCMKTCKPQALQRLKKIDKSVCELPWRTAPCDETTPMFVFNRRTKKCRKLSPGLCSINENKFVSLGKCFKTCKSGRG